MPRSVSDVGICQPRGEPRAMPSLGRTAALWGVPRALPSLGRTASLWGEPRALPSLGRTAALWGFESYPEQALLAVLPRVRLRTALPRASLGLRYYPA